MNVSRDAVYNALMATLVTGCGGTFVTISRRFRSWTDTSADQMPAMYIVAGSQRADEPTTFGNTRWTLRAKLFIYVAHSPDSDSPGSPLMNVLDVVDSALQPPVYQSFQNLGINILRAWIDGETMIDEGQLPQDNKSIAVVPVTIQTGQ